MSTIPAEGTPPLSRKPIVTVLDDDRGRIGMWFFIITEATLFLLLFFSYFYLGKGNWRWPTDEPPKLHFAIIMLAVLFVSSVVLHWGEKHLKEQRYRQAAVGLRVTILLGVVFVILQALEYREHLRTLTPHTDTYGSIFYTITSFHGAHLLLGLLMLIYVGLLPRWEPNDRSPHRPYHVASMYWHFVDVVWFFIVAFLYIAPHLAKL